jgi:hypothetical protein
MDVSENSDIEDEIKDIDENYISPFVSDPDQEEDNTDVKMESKEKKGRVYLFMWL